MTESEYWASLEYRVTRELGRMDDNALRSLWCDGFIPERFAVDNADPHITGAVWICSGPRQHRWEFRLDLGRTVDRSADVRWANLLPADDATGWLTVDLEGRRIRINPSQALAA